MIHAGVRLAPQEEGGPVINSYSPDFLRSIGLLPRTAVDLPTFERAVREAVKRKKVGLLTFLFLRDARFQEFTAAWREMGEIAKRAEIAGVEPDLPKIRRTIEDCAREAFIRLASERKLEAELAWTQDATCDASKASHERDTLGMTPAELTQLDAAYGGKAPFGTTEISGKRWTLGLDNDARAQLGIHPRPI
jgi:hypothetical protein